MLTCLTKDIIFLRACVRRLSAMLSVLFVSMREWVASVSLNVFALIDVCERFDSNLFACVSRVIETIKWKRKPTRKSLVQSRSYINRINVRDELIFGICVVSFFFIIFFKEEIHKRQTWHYTHAVLVSSCIFIYRVNPCTSQPIIHALMRKQSIFFDSVIFKSHKLQIYNCGISIKRFQVPKDSSLLRTFHGAGIEIDAYKACS